MEVFEFILIVLEKYLAKLCLETPGYGMNSIMEVFEFILVAFSILQKLCLELQGNVT